MAERQVFSVRVDPDLASEVDILAAVRGCDRARILAEALRTVVQAAPERSEINRLRKLMDARPPQTG